MTRRVWTILAPVVGLVVVPSLGLLPTGSRVEAYTIAGPANPAYSPSYTYASLPDVPSPARLAMPAPALPSLSSNASVFATGLDNPRGLKFRNDGQLYVAEAGRGGTTSTVGQCAQVPAPLGPLTGGKTGRVSWIDPAGHRFTAATGLASAQTTPFTGGEVLGPTDVAFVGNTPHVLVQAGCSKGHVDAPNSIVRINPNGSLTQVANLSAFYLANPTNFPPDEDNDPEANPYGMVSVGSDLYVVEANHDEVDRVTSSGTVSRLADIANAVQGHITPTAITVGPGGDFYVGNLSPLPYTDGSAKILRITPAGQVSVFASGLTAVLGVQFDCLGRLYVLETATGNTPFPPFLNPGTGRVRRLTPASTFETVASGLTAPTAMTFGPDGALYASHRGYGLGPVGGQGEIVKIDVGLGRTCRVGP